ncbi:MAG TPA: DUF6273 domain-containing protein [Anaerolineae bacterium]|nr:DUF6273 domain-containing protein [Anaerolineae bacterium]
MNIGSVIPFGNYQWRILDIEESKMLIITDQIVEQRDYHDKKEDVTWEHSEIRRYLNNTFFDRFSSSEKERILTTLNRNPDNPWYGSLGGADTVDKVFLLSLDEVVRLYFGDSSRLLDNPKPNQRYWFDHKDENNIKRTALFMDLIWWWWTRTPGKNNKVAVYIHGDGNIGIQGNGISKTSFNTLHYITKSNEGGVRPAMWVKQ